MNVQADGADGAAQASPPASGRARHLSRFIGISAVLAAAVVLYLCATRWNAWTSDARHQRTENAYLQTDLTSIATRQAGLVRLSPAKDFQAVRAGETIVELDDEDYRAMVAQAEANAAVARAALESLAAQRSLQKANIDATEALVTGAAAALDRARRLARRQHTLLDGGSASQDQVEAADATRLSAAAELAKSGAARLAAVRQLGVLAAQEAQARASSRAAEAAAELARINLRHTRIVAPYDGVLGQRQVRPGQYLPAGGQVATLAPLPRIWVIANYKETQLTRIRPGQSASIRVDAFPEKVLTGRVVDYAPATGAQFALLPPDNATGNFTKIVQRLAVKITIDDAAGLAQRLRPGMSVVVDVDTGSE